jgi:hypothetical protein
VTPSEFEDLVGDLRSSEVDTRRCALIDVRDHPTGDCRVIPYLQSLCEDTAICVVSLPFLFGEIRWLAAHALAAEYRVAKLDTQVTLRVIKPINTDEFVAIRDAASIVGKGGVDGVIKTLGQLQRLGLLPFYEIWL